MGEETNLSSVMYMPNLQNKDDKEKISSHELDYELDSEESLVICQPNKQKLIKDATVKELVLESKEEAKQIHCEGLVHFRMRISR